MTVDELARRMSSRELVEWAAIFKDEAEAAAVGNARAGLEARASAGAAGMRAKLGIG